MARGSLLGRVLSFYPIRRLLGWPLRRQFAAFDRAAGRPQQVQEEMLRGILAAQAGTAFGSDHGFNRIATVADFRRQLPVAPYEYHEPYIARVRRGEFNALLANPVVHMFALTSGTTATRKYIPVTPEYLRGYRKGWNLWGLRAFIDHPAVRFKPIVQLCGDWDESRTEAGTPCGSITGLTAQMQKWMIRWLYCVPACTGRIADAHAKYYAALRLSLPRRVGMLLAANPSTLVNLARAGDQDKEALIRDLHDGTLNPRLDIPDSVRAALARRLRKEPERARELEAIVARTGTLHPKDYWPPERLLIGTWTGGSVGVYLRHLPRYYGAAAVRDPGLIASEGRMTIPIADGTPGGILDVTTHYFEFIPEAEGDRKQPTVLGAHELQEGQNYFILLTTAYGLYRYHIHDLVRVTGFHQRTPNLEFLSKGAHFSSLTGEKLSEYQVTQAVQEAARVLGLTLTTYSLAPCWNEEAPYYGLFVERGDLADAGQGRRLAAELDRQLGAANVEYAAKRTSRRLDTVRVLLLPAGAWHEWDRQRLARNGGNLEQYKHPCLIADLQFRASVPVEAELAAGEPAVV